MTKRFQTVFLLTDFSAHARNACLYAMSLFKSDVEYVLINTYELSSSAATLIDLDEMAHQECVISLKTEREELLSNFSGDISMQILASRGRPYDVINRFQLQYDATVVVMGTRGKTNRRNILIGSATKSVMRNVNLPVLSVPLSATFKGLNKVVVSSELKEPLGKEAQEWINVWKSHFKFKIAAVSICQEPVALSVAENTVREQIASQLRIRELQLAENDDIPLGLAKFAAEDEADLLVLIAKHTGFFNRIFHKSITSEMMNIEFLPILILEDN
jgi:nucleotide-binding universal stress UspA family protein